MDRFLPDLLKRLEILADKVDAGGRALQEAKQRILDLGAAGELAWWSGAWWGGITVAVAMIVLYLLFLHRRQP